MSLSTLLTIIDGRTGSESALRTALCVGEKLGAYVEAFHVRDFSMTMAPVVPEAMSTVLVQEMLDAIDAQAEERAKVARDLYETHCVALGIPQADPGGTPELGKHCAAFVEISGLEEEETAKRGRLFDLLVFGQPASQDLDRMSPALRAALFETGRPVLMAPAETPGSVGTRIAIAWDNSREATRACAACLSFAAQAEAVTIVSVREAGSAAEPADLAQYLSRHGIQADTRTIDPGDQTVGHALLGVAEQLDADLLVAGAYGHSRFHEYIFGGATKELIADAPLPVLMAH